MSKGYVALVLNAHLPFTRHPEYENFFEERWLFEAISETYIPLLNIFETLEKNNINFKITLSLSPTLLAMLDDSLLQEKYIKYLKNLIELSQKEIARTKSNPELNKLAEMYFRKYTDDLNLFIHKYNQNLIIGFKKFQESKNVEIITSCATHSYLPLFTNTPEALKAQIGIGKNSYTEYFSNKSKGLWLPECGYTKELEKYIEGFDFDYTILESHGLIFADPTPIYGTFSPVVSPNGIVMFGRDAQAAKQVWDVETGYPSNPVYRDFYKDIGFDLDTDYIAPYINPDGARISTGIKYHKITGKEADKDIYNYDIASKKAIEDALNFTNSRREQLNFISDYMDKPPLVVCPYDAELFGHWWFEGPIWLKHVLETLSNDDTCELITLSEYIEKYPVMQIAEPCASSWGYNGYNEFWLNNSTDWIYKHLHIANKRMTELTNLKPNALGTEKLALKQAARELLLAQSSDWPFMIKSGTTVQFAVKTLNEHLNNFNKLYTQIKENKIDSSFLEELQNINNLFPDVDYNLFGK